MPRRPNVPCRHRGCPAIVSPTIGWCEKHAREPQDERKAKQRQWDAKRGTAKERGYDATWRRLRMMVLRAQPICAICRHDPAVMVDHIVPMAKGGERLDRDNLQGLCNTCHGRKTWRETMGKCKRYVVCGAPGSGKTRWVDRHRKKGDVVWDMDAVAGSLGFPTYPRPHWLTDVLLLWFNMLATKLTSVEVVAYLIVTDRTKAEDVARRVDAELIDMGSA